jgi:hypothetical protein
MTSLDTTQEVCLAHPGIPAQEQPRHANASRQPQQVLNLPLNALHGGMVHIQVLQDVLGAQQVVLLGDRSDDGVEMPQINVA